MIATGSDLEDLDEASEGALAQFGRIDLRQLLHPVVLKALVGIVVAALILVSPRRADRILSYAFAVGLLVVGIPVLVASLRHRRDIGAAMAATIGIGVSVLLLLTGARSQSTLAQLIGACGVIFGVRSLYTAARTQDRWTSWVSARGLAMLTLGGLTIVFPNELFAIVTVIAALDWITVGVVAVAVSLDRDAPRLSSFEDTTDLMLAWIEDRPKTADDRVTMYAKVLYEGSERRQKTVRFFVLTGLAAVISAMGIITDSPAVVIGAMLISPLMRPLMGMALSLTMGWPERLLGSTLLLLAGIVMSIVVALVISALAPTAVDVMLNGQIASRSTPTLLDLIIALAAGTAGAYGVSRPDVSDALPGVAVAIALLPPLSVVGIAYSEGAWETGNGALLLFATNAVAILTMGGVTFVYTGVVPLRKVTSDQRRTKTWGAALVTIIGLVLGGLLLNGAEITQNSLELAAIEQQAIDWLEGSDEYELLDVGIDGDLVDVVIAGPAANPPRVDDLVLQLKEATGRGLAVDLRLIVQQRFQVAAIE